MNYILFDDINRGHLLPLTFMRAVADIRCGILTIRQKWNYKLNTDCFVFTAAYLRKKFPLIIKDTNIFINGNLFPDDNLIEKISQLNPGQAITADNCSYLIAFSVDENIFNKLSLFADDYIDINSLKNFKFIEFNGNYNSISRPWHIFEHNSRVISEDFQMLTTNRLSASLSDTNRYRGERKNIFIEDGANIEYSIFNAEAGPIYIGKNVEIMENCTIRGPFAVCDNSMLKIGTKIYGGTTIGPYCRVGGEVSNTVFFAYSNKAHDGFVGDSVISEWCNLGADTNVSNLKNTYDIVKLWSYPEKKFISTGHQFCGLIMGDHTKTSINTMFNTGTSVGVGVNIFGSGFPRNYIPSFSWGGAAGFKKYHFDKFIETSRSACKRRNVILSDTDIEILEILYTLSD